MTDNGPKNNFCRVFELPTEYPKGYCFGGGLPVTMKMVDWFNPWPDPVMFKLAGKPELIPNTWEDVKAMLIPQLKKKIYVKPGRTYVLITDFGESFIFGKE